MRRRLRVLIVLASTLAMVLVLGVGTAFANDKGAATHWTCLDVGGQGEGEFCDFTTDRAVADGVAAERAFAPVGSHFPAAAGNGPGFVNPDSPAAVALFNNPLCPFHDVSP